MGWETTLLAPISFNRETFTSKGQVEDKLEECRETIKYLRSKVKNLVFITEPRKFCGEDEDPIHWLNSKVEEYLERLEEELWDEARLSILLDAWDKCHMRIEEDGQNVEVAVTTPPELGFIWEHAYIDGDFIKPYFPNGEKAPDKFYSSREEYNKEHNIKSIDPRKRIG